jgi:hypothetical protein
MSYNLNCKINRYTSSLDWLSSTEVKHMNTNYSNRRTATRFKKEFLVGLQDSNENFCQSRTLNVSASGLRLVVNQAVGEGVPLHLTLCLDEDNLVELEGVTVWQERLGNMGTHIVGLAFKSGQPEPTRKLVRWLSHNGAAA